MQYLCSWSWTVIQTQCISQSVFNYKTSHEGFTVIKIDRRQFGNLDILAVVNFAGVIGISLWHICLWRQAPAKRAAAREWLRAALQCVHPYPHALCLYTWVVRIKASSVRRSERAEMQWCGSRRYLSTPAISSHDGSCSVKMRIMAFHEKTAPNDSTSYIWNWRVFSPLSLLLKS